MEYRGKMETIEFWKMNGSGNDFILIDNRNGLIKDEELSRVVERVCRRRESVGADGLILVTGSDRYDFGWRFLNADGGEGEMCGNGGRCVSRFAFLKGIAGPKMTFETLAGPISAEVEGRTVKILIPGPKGLDMDIDLEGHQGWKTVDFINTGVPHVVVQVENANFMRQIGPDQLEIRTYERGVEDETLACGTGAIACALVASIRGMVISPVKVRTRGGEDLTIHFQRNGDSFNEVWLQGNTSIVYRAQLHHEAL
jgi:diaminopimelate epimerase